MVFSFFIHSKRFEKTFSLKRTEERLKILLPPSKCPVQSKEQWIALDNYSSVENIFIGNTDDDKQFLVALENTDRSRRKKGAMQRLSTLYKETILHGIKAIDLDSSALFVIPDAQYVQLDDRAFSVPPPLKKI